MKRGLCASAAAIMTAIALVGLPIAALATSEETDPLPMLSADDSDMADMPMVSADPEREELDDLAARRADVLEDGTFALASALEDGSALAVDESDAPGVAQSPSEEQASWVITHDAAGYVVIAQASSGRVLGASSSSRPEGSRVTLGAPSGSWAQKWVAVPEGGGVALVSALDRDLALDASGGSLSLRRHDGSAGQLWSPIDPAQLADGPENAPADPLAQAVPAGTYYLTSSFGGGRVLQAADGSSVGASFVSGATAQRWEISYDAEGYATIVSRLSGMALAVEGGSPNPGARVAQSTLDGSLAQKWVIESVSGPDGQVGFRLRPALSRTLALDVSAGSATGGVALRALNGSEAQTFSIVDPSQLSQPIPGTYQLRCAANPTQVIDVATNSSANGANIEVYEDYGGDAQIWDVWRNDDGTYLIKNAASGKALDVAGGVAASGTNVQLWQKQGNAAQAWTIAYDRAADGYRIASALDPSLVLTVAGSATSGTNVVIATDTGAPTQRFLLDEASYTPPILNTIEWIGARWYSEGRQGNDWMALVIHISECTTLSAIDNTFLGTSETSAHYGVSSTEIHQYVSLDDTAWAVGYWTWNTKTVSIEHVGTTSWPPSRATLDRSAQLMAALARLKQWPELVLGENVGIHKWYSATSCPATLDVTYLVSKANEYMGNGFTYKSVDDGAAKPTLSTMASPTPTALIA